MLNRLLPDGQIIHVSRKFYCSRRMQDIRSCCQQVCSFITGHGKVPQQGKTTENTFCLMFAYGVDHYFRHDYSCWQTALEKYNVINMRIHFETFVYLRFRWPLLISSRLLSHVYQWDIFFPSEVDIMNTPHQCCDSFFTLLATKPPVRTAVAVTPIIDLARRSRSSQLAFWCFCRLSTLPKCLTPCLQGWGITCSAETNT